MAATTTSRKRKGRGNIQKKANGNYLGRLRIAGYDTFYVTGTSEKEVQKAQSARQELLKELELLI